MVELKQYECDDIIEFQWHKLTTMRSNKLSLINSHGESILP